MTELDSTVVRSPDALRRRGASLAFKGVAGIAVLSAALLAAIVLAMNTYGKRLVVAESQRRIEEAGNRSVAELQRRSREIAALAKTMAQTAANLPKDEATFSALLPGLVDFQKDISIAGGGLWPEANAFTPGIERRSFFWARDKTNQLVPILDYNAPLGPGYQNEEWYVPVKFLPPGSTFWSRSYQDPFSYQLVATCAANVVEGGRVTGVTTINLKLEGLGALVKGWQKTTGGYGFLLDRNNKFLSYPQPAKVRTSSLDDAGNRTEDFLYAYDFAAKEPRFQPFASAVVRMDQDILARARRSRRWDPTLPAKIDANSYAVNREQAEAIAAVMADPLAEDRARGSSLYTSFEVANDPVLGKPSLAFVFNVPDSYWKLVFVIPVAEAEAVATQISRRLVLSLAAILLPLLVLAYVLLNRTMIRPVTGLARAASSVRDGNFEIAVPDAGRDELGVLSASFNNMVQRLKANTQSLQQSNEELRRNLNMTDTIMGTVHEGLFLLDPSYRIAPKYSGALHQIFGRTELAGESFLDLVRRVTPAKTHELTERFLKLLFNAEKGDGVVAKINPLKEVEASFQGEGGQLEEKFLTFTFDRIWDQGEIRQAMVTVSDVTARVQLSRELAASRQRMERQAELLLSVLHVEPEMLRDFVDGAHAELELVNDALRHGQIESMSVSERQAHYQRLTDQIFRSVHTIKGTASMLRIEYFVQAAHRFEEKLHGLRRRSNLDGNDFLPIVLELSEMVDSLVEIRDVVHRFSQAGPSEAGFARSDSDLLARVVEQFVADLAAKHGKQATVSFQAEAKIQIPFKLKAPVRNVLAQLVRNSMVHGLETPAERMANGKAPKGSIQVSARRKDGRLELVYRDDGRGLDYTRIVERAKEMAASDPELLERLVDRKQNRWKVEELDRLVFHPGFSTASEVTEDAGRGVGLSAVKETVEALGGTVAIRQQTGQFCELQVSLPLTLG